MNGRNGSVLTDEQIARFRDALRDGEFFVYQGEGYAEPSVTVNGRGVSAEFEYVWECILG